MANITITIPDAQAQRVLDAFCGRFGYQATLPDGTPNPQTQAQFTRAQIAEWVKRTTVSYETDRAATTAQTDANAQINVT